MTKQLCLPLCLSVCVSVCLFVCLSVHLSHLFHYVPFIVSSLPGVITNDKSEVNAKGQGQRSKVKTQLSRFRTMTPVRIDIWQWNDAQSLMLLRRGALLFFKVISQISRSYKTQKSLILTKLDVSGLYLQFEFTDGYEMMHKAWSRIGEVSYCFSRSFCQISILNQIVPFWTVTQVWIHPWLWKDAQNLMQHRRGALFFSRSSVKF